MPLCSRSHVPCRYGTPLRGSKSCTFSPLYVGIISTCSAFHLRRIVILVPVESLRTLFRYHRGRLRSSAHACFLCLGQRSVNGCHFCRCLHTRCGKFQLKSYYILHGFRRLRCLCVHAWCDRLCAPSALTGVGGSPTSYVARLAQRKARLPCWCPVRQRVVDAKCVAGSACGDLEQCPDCVWAVAACRGGS